MVELRRSFAAVIGCYARVEVLDAVSDLEALTMRLAPDEMLLVAEPRHGAAILATAETALAADPGSIVLEVSDGYSIWSVAGDWEEVSLRLCAVPISQSSALIQTLFAQVPAKPQAQRRGRRGSRRSPPAARAEEAGQGQAGTGRRRDWHHPSGRLRPARR